MSFRVINCRIFSNPLPGLNLLYYQFKISIRPTRPSFKKGSRPFYLTTTSSPFSFAHPTYPYGYLATRVRITPILLPSKSKIKTVMHDPYMEIFISFYSEACYTMMWSNWDPNGRNKYSPLPCMTQSTLDAIEIPLTGSKEPSCRPDLPSAPS